MKYSNYTHVKINAEILNKTTEQEEQVLTDVDMGDSDILIVEIPKNGEDFVFQPEVTDIEDEDFEDPLNSKKMQELQSSKF